MQNRLSKQNPQLFQTPFLGIINFAFLRNQIVIGLNVFDTVADGLLLYHKILVAFQKITSNLKIQNCIFPFQGIFSCILIYHPRKTGIMRKSMPSAGLPTYLQATVNYFTEECLPDTQTNMSLG